MTHHNHTASVTSLQSFPRHWLRQSTWQVFALVALGASLAWSQAHAQATDAPSHTGQGAPSHTAAATPAADSQELSEGEVTRWNPSTGKITLRHGELKNLAMPPMTMVFTVQDPAQASQIKKGDRVRFRAEQVTGAFVATHLEVAQ